MIVLFIEVLFVFYHCTRLFYRLGVVFADIVVGVVDIIILIVICHDILRCNCY